MISEWGLANKRRHLVGVEVLPGDIAPSRELARCDILTHSGGYFFNLGLGQTSMLLDSSLRVFGAVCTRRVGNLVDASF